MENNGLRTTVLKANTVKPEKREKWIQDKVSQIDVMISHPRLVQTGLDLIDFPTFVFQEIEFSISELHIFYKNKTPA